MSPSPHLVVVTPIKNEGLLLRRFLEVSSTFADAIVVADQGSEDESREICSEFPKARLFPNPLKEYDEAARQRLLLDLCRQHTPSPRVILALDADEIVAADAVHSAGWQRMLAAAPGTVLFMHKPDLIDGTSQCLRYEEPWPLGFVDDGSPHLGKRIHSIRVPMEPDSPRLYLDDVIVLHYALARLDLQRSKARLYAALENVHRSQPLYARRFHYSKEHNWRGQGLLSPSDPSWFQGWEDRGIDVRSLPTQTYYWQDFELLRLLAAHGGRRFWLDPIWDADWEGCRLAGLERGLAGLPSRPVSIPPASVRWAGRLIDRLYLAWLRAVRKRGPA